MTTNRTVLIHVGDRPEHVTAAKTITLAIDTAEPGAVIDAIVDAGLQPSDFRTRVITSFDCAVDIAVVTYAALCGFAGRRLDVAGRDEVLTVAGSEHVGAAALEQHSATITHDAQLDGETRPLCVQIGAAHRTLPAWPFSPEGVAAAHLAKRVRYVPPADTFGALGQLMVLAGVRVKDNVERFPYLAAGDEPVGDDPVAVAGIDVDGVRRAALSRRRQMRRDDRSTVVDPIAPTARMQRLETAAGQDITETLEKLGATHTVDGDTVMWTCPRTSVHSQPEPTVRVTDGKAHCGRCDIEHLDSLRLVMASLRLTADEAADWLENTPA